MTTDPCQRATDPRPGSSDLLQRPSDTCQGPSDYSQQPSDPHRGRCETRRTACEPPCRTPSDLSQTPRPCNTQPMSSSETRCRKTVTDQTLSADTCHACDACSTSNTQQQTDNVQTSSNNTCQVCVECPKPSDACHSPCGTCQTLQQQQQQQQQHQQQQQPSCPTVCDTGSRPFDTQQLQQREKRVRNDPCREVVIVDDLLRKPGDPPCLRLCAKCRKQFDNNRRQRCERCEQPHDDGDDDGCPPLCADCQRLHDAYCASCDAYCASCDACRDRCSTCRQPCVECREQCDDCRRMRRRRYRRQSVDDCVCQGDDDDDDDDEICEDCRGRCRRYQENRNWSCSRCDRHNTDDSRTVTAASSDASTYRGRDAYQGRAAHGGRGAYRGWDSYDRRDFAWRRPRHRRRINDGDDGTYCHDLGDVSRDRRVMMTSLRGSTYEDTRHRVTPTSSLLRDVCYGDDDAEEQPRRERRPAAAGGGGGGGGGGCTDRSVGSRSGASSSSTPRAGCLRRDRSKHPRKGYYGSNRIGDDGSADDEEEADGGRGGGGGGNGSVWWRRPPCDVDGDDDRPTTRATMTRTAVDAPLPSSSPCRATTDSPSTSSKTEFWFGVVKQWFRSTRILCKSSNDAACDGAFGGTAAVDAVSRTTSDNGGGGRGCGGRRRSSCRGCCRSDDDDDDLHGRSIPPLCDHIAVPEIGARLCGPRSEFSGDDICGDGGGGADTERFVVRQTPIPPSSCRDVYGGRLSGLDQFDGVGLPCGNACGVVSGGGRGDNSFCVPSGAAAEMRERISSTTTKTAASVIFVGLAVAAVCVGTNKMSH